MASEFANIAGQWELVEWAFCWCVELPESDPDDTQIDGYRFLYDKNFDGLGVAEPVFGSVLRITPDGLFQQQGKGEPPLASYDLDGIQIDGIDPFGGHLHAADGVFYLLADGVADDDLPADAQHRQRLRLDSGNTQICDYLDADGENLRRKMMVTTDWAYGDCVMLTYRRLAVG